MIVQIVDELRKAERAGSAARDVPAHPLAKAVQVFRHGLACRNLAGSPPAVLAHGGKGTEKSLDPGARVALNPKGPQVGRAEVAHVRRTGQAGNELLRHGVRGKQVARLFQAGVERLPVHRVVGMSEVRKVGTHPIQQLREVRRRDTPPFELVQKLGHAILSHGLARAERELGQHRRDRLATAQHSLGVCVHPTRTYLGRIEREERVCSSEGDARVQLLKTVVVAHENREVLKEHLKALGIDPCPGERIHPSNRLQDGG